MALRDYRARSQSSRASIRPTTDKNSASAEKITANYEQQTSATDLNRDTRAVLKINGASPQISEAVR